MKSYDIGCSHLLIMVGLPGSGKSFFAEHFAETFNAPLISYGKLSKELMCRNEATKELNLGINRIEKYMLEEISKTKRTIIFDGKNYNRSSFEELSKIANKLDYLPLYIFVQTDIETAKKRSISKANENHMSVEQFDKILKQFKPIDRTKKHVVVISGKHTYSSQLKIVLKYLSENN